MSKKDCKKKEQREGGRKGGREGGSDVKTSRCEGEGESHILPDGAS